LPFVEKECGVCTFFLGKWGFEAYFVGVTLSYTKEKVGLFFFN
jgi:hypothetical protein